MMKADGLTTRLETAYANCQVPVGKVYGRLQRVKGICLEATGCRLSTGQRCLVGRADGKTLEAEVVGFDGGRLFLMPLEQPAQLSSGDWVMPIEADNRV
ncbi:MAG: hypothetical protein ACR2PT_04645, partial [Endozoicomonas sp.]